ncbi:MAG: M13-type metalloendopeptidase [Prevotella sp.]
MIRKFIFYLMSVMAAFSVISCSDDDVESVVDNKTMPFNTYSTTTRANDDFYEYCLGPWLEQANEGDSYRANVEDILNSTINSAYLREHGTYIINLLLNRTSPEQQLAISEYVGTLEDEIGNITTQDEAVQYLAKTYHRAISPFFFYVYYFQDDKGRMKNSIEPVFDWSELMDWFESDEAKYALDMVSFLHNYNTTTNKQRAALVPTSNAISKFNVKRQKPVSLDNMQTLPANTRYTTTVRSTSGTKTFLDYLINTNFPFTVPYSSEAEYLSKMEKVKMLNQRISTLGRDSILAFCLQQYYNEYHLTGIPGGRDEEMVSDLFQASDISQYGMAAACFYNECITDDMVKRGTDVTNRIKEALRNRLKNNTWMSATAINYAQQKLDSMKIYICGTGKVNEYFLQKRTDNNILEYIHKDYVQYNKWLNAMIGKRLRDVVVDYYNNIEQMRILDVDPFYINNANTLIVLPAYLMSPIYSDSNTDAMTYAMLGTLIGREMTKAFDYNGAFYMADGVSGDWWTMQDKMRYVEIRRNLAYCYQNIPLDFGFTQNATFTIDENTADCGGLTLALDAYTTLLKEQGYSGETLKEQQRKMLRCYAQLYAQKYSEAQIYDEQCFSTYANAKARVNGPVMNLDAFYDLYNVTADDKMYIAPAYRSCIWQ